jgi:glycerate dehydrogenase
MPMKIVVLDGQTMGMSADAWDGLRQLGEVEIYDQTSPDEVLERARTAGVLITNKAPISAALMAQAPELRFITMLATGFDPVDVAAARSRGIPVSNVPEYGTESVAQLTFALLLELCNQVALHAEAVRAGEWTRAPTFSFWKTPLFEMAGRTMGIIGFGRIGRSVGDVAHAFGMGVLAHDQPQFQVNPPAYQPFAWATLDELFSRADVISLHCPLTPENRGLVNRKRLRLVKPTAYVLNTARGPLVVEEDLAEALNEGRLAGAGLDVVAREPIEPDNVLLTARNCLVTPHIAWATVEARQRLLETAVANVANFLAGKPTNVVN